MLMKLIFIWKNIKKLDTTLSFNFHITHTYERLPNFKLGRKKTFKGEIMFSKKKIIVSVVILLVVGILGSQTFLPSGFFNDSIRAFALVYQKSIIVKSISLEKQTLKLKVNEMTKLKFTMKPANATRKSPSWYSSNKKVVTVAKDGTILAVGNGTATITAFTETQFADCKISVSGVMSLAVKGITIDKSLTLKVKGTKQLVATFAPINAANKAVTWTSSNSSVASVDAKGKITAKKAGTAKITVKTKDGNKTSTCTVTVKK
jgi:uncharacterized protein YjdB